MFSDFSVPTLHVCCYFILFFLKEEKIIPFYMPGTFLSKRGIEYSLFILLLYQNSGIMTTLLCASEVVLVIHSGYSQI